jgi:hypothetical protein
LDLSALIDLVLGLVVNEDPGIPSSLEEAIEQWLELWVSKHLKRIVFANLEHISDH